MLTQIEAPLLFLSTRSNYETGKPIRGGVPVIFPWFGPREGDTTHMHGFVRTRPWHVREVRQIWIHRIIDHDGGAVGEGGIEAWLRLGEACGHQNMMNLGEADERGTRSGGGQENLSLRFD